MQRQNRRWDEIEAACLSFIRNPVNIIRCMLLALSLLFLSSLLSIPDLSNQPPTYILDYLAYSKVNLTKNIFKLLLGFY